MSTTIRLSDKIGKGVTVLILVTIALAATIWSSVYQTERTVLSDYNRPDARIVVRFHGFPLGWYVTVIDQFTWLFPLSRKAPCELFATCPYYAPFGFVWFTFMVDVLFYVGLSYVPFLIHDWRFHREPHSKRNEPGPFGPPLHV